MTSWSMNAAWDVGPLSALSVLTVCTSICTNEQYVYKTVGLPVLNYICIGFQLFPDSIQKSIVTLFACHSERGGIDFFIPLDCSEKTSHPFYVVICI